MIEISFRGLTEENKFVYGSLVISGVNKNWVIFESSGKSYIVNPKTVGQYTGQKDKHGRKIYEGDILKEPYNKYSYKPVSTSYGVIQREKDNCNFELRWFFETIGYDGIKYWSENFLGIRYLSKYEITGNIHQNPDMLIKKNN